VDNDPVSGRTAALVGARPEASLRYAREPRRGLAAAHNRGLEVAQGSIVAFTDDDVVVDARWLAEVAGAFATGDNVGCVTGLIMPAELATQAQLRLEAHGRFGKGFQPRLVDRGEHRPDDPLFPFATGRLGSGANMSFRADLLRELGGFDPAAGVGTVARGGDDLASFLAVLAAGHALAYQPSAIVWHRHRRDQAALRRQAFGYGVGLGAYLASIPLNHPALVGQALRRARTGLAYALDPAPPRNARAGGGSWPRELVWAQRCGLALGPLAYGVSRWRSRGAQRPVVGRAGRR
jgi:O-antigen biosynthesis protein